MMKILILILSINFLGLIKGERSNEIWHSKIGQDNQEENEELDHSIQKSEHPTCKETCKCVPDVDDISFTPVRELKVKENTVLECNQGRKIKRLESFNREYKYNVTCNGIDTSKVPFQEGYLTVVLDDGNDDKRESMNLKHKYRINHWNQGSQSYWVRGIIANTECAGDTLMVYGHWVANDPLYGCCGEGVNLWTAVIFTVEIIGKCCNTCHLLHSSYASEQSLTN